MRIGAAKETAGFSGDSTYRAHNGLRTYTDLLSLGFSTRAKARRAQVAYKEKVK